ncbi:transmembrane protein 217-like [Rhinoraja longicauda]
MNLHKILLGLKKLVHGNVCGLSDKEGCIVAGMFTLVTSTLHLIFEAGNLRIYSLTNYTRGNTERVSFQYALHRYCLTSIGFVTLCYLAIFILFLSIWKEVYWGIGGYVTWVFFFELGQLCLLIFFMPQHEDFPKTMNAMECTGLVLRVIIQLYWIIFFIRYTLELYRSKMRTDDLVKVRQKGSQRLKFGSVVEMGV